MSLYRLYVPAHNQPDAHERAAALGCDGVAAAMPEPYRRFIVTLPCVIVDDRNGNVIAVPEPVDWASLAASVAPLETAVAATAATVATVAANRQTIVARLQAAIAANNAFLAIPVPTPLQTANHHAALTRQMNALLKLAVNDLADITGT